MSNSWKGKRSASSTGAQQLLSAGAPMTFGSFAANTATQTNNQTLIECDSLGDEFRIPFRHLNKKDSKTKLRALKELCGLFQQCNDELLGGALSSWVLAIRRLSDDADRQVRQELWVVMQVIMTRVTKEQRRPHMKSLMGCWWLQCHDPAKEVREAACSALEAGIARSKWNEVLWNCREEVVQQICTTLQQTQDSVMQVRKVAKQEATQHLHQTLPAALSSLAQFITSLSEKQPDQLAEVLGPAVQPFFWKLIKSSIPQVRRAAFGVVAQLARTAPSALGSRIKAAARALLGGFSERDGGNLDALWQAVLLFCKSEAGAAGWAAVDAEKTVWPALWQLVRHGGHAGGCTTYRAMLPFLSVIPGSAVEPVENWIKELLHSLWEAQFSAQHMGCEAAIEVN